MSGLADPPTSYSAFESQRNNGDANCQTTPLMSRQTRSSGYGATGTPPVFISSATAIKSRLAVVTAIGLLLFFFIIFLALHSPVQPRVQPPEDRFDEIVRYRNSGMHWGLVQLGDCQGTYHNREYIAQLLELPLSRLYDRNKACQYMPIEIQNQYFESPDKRELRGLNTYGYWNVYNEMDCTINDEIQKYRNSGMYWSGAQAEECLPHERRMYKARLRGIPSSYNSDKACRYMPNKILDEAFERPVKCEHRGADVYGYWEVHDEGDVECRLLDEIQKYRNSGMYWDIPQSGECHFYDRRIYSAKLRDIPDEFDRNKACMYLPIEIHGQAFERPDKCEPTGSDIYGHWVVHDPTDCTLEDEIEKYRSSGMFWDTPQASQHCHSYNTREYEAHLREIPYGYDWNKACNYMPVTIQDRFIEKPDICQRRESGQYGKWLVSDQLDCKPYWSPLKDVGCQASGKKRYEASLWNLIEGDDWYNMCASTPATWNGRFYKHPTNCDYRKRGGMVGIWEEERCS